MRVHFDVRTKVFLLLAINIGIFFINALIFEAAIILFLVILQILSGKKVFSSMVTLAYFILVLIQLFLLPILPGTLKMILSVPTINFRKMFPCIMVLILLIRTTKVNEAIATMTKMHMPKVITVTFAVTLRYIPVLGEEWRYIHDAMRIRQISVHHLGVMKASCIL